MDNLYPLISRVSGLSYDPLWAEKLPYIVQGVMYGAFFSIAAGVCFFFYARKGEERRFAAAALAVTALFIVGKYAIYHAFKGYIPDRLLLYALPSPRAYGILWFLLPLCVIGIYIALRDRILRLSDRRFVAAMAAVFVLFSFAVNGIREGEQSIVDPLTRTTWEYTGNLPLIHSAKDFLRDYTSLLPRLAHHSTTHPPGYTLFLYGVQTIFSAGYLGMALALALLPGAAAAILYSVWRRKDGEERARRLVELFLFLPGLVTYAVSSLDVLLLFLSAAAFSAMAAGWKRSALLSALAGIAAAAALLSNFLFLLLGPYALYLVYAQLRDTTTERRAVVFRVSLTMATFALFFAVLYWWSGYSIIENFFAAREANQNAVESNFASGMRFLAYAFMSATDVLFFMGAPLLASFAMRPRESLVAGGTRLREGMAILVFFLAVSVFQGETGRLWLFLYPLFIFLGYRLVVQGDRRYERLIVLLLAFQSIILNTALYTYW